MGGANGNWANDVDSIVEIQEAAADLNRKLIDNPPFVRDVKSQPFPVIAVLHVILEYVYSQKVDHEIDRFHCFVFTNRTTFAMI